MARRRFRWTRKAYRQAQHLARLINRLEYLPDEPPPLVQRYLDLWSEHEAAHGWCIDPLATSLSTRLSMFKGDDIPF